MKIKYTTFSQFKINTGEVITMTKKYSSFSEFVAHNISIEDMEDLIHWGIDTGFNPFLYYSDMREQMHLYEDSIFEDLNGYAAYLGYGTAFELLNITYGEALSTFNDFVTYAIWTLVETYCSEWHEIYSADIAKLREEDKDLSLAEFLDLTPYLELLPSLKTPTITNKRGGKRHA